MRLTAAVPEASLEQIFGRPVAEKKTESALTSSDPGISPASHSKRAARYACPSSVLRRARASQPSVLDYALPILPRRDGAAAGHFEAKGKRSKGSKMMPGIDVLRGMNLFHMGMGRL